jgi:hypothetical protein
MENILEKIYHQKILEVRNRKKIKGLAQICSELKCQEPKNNSRNFLQNLQQKTIHGRKIYRLFYKILAKLNNQYEKINKIFSRISIPLLLDANNYTLSEKNTDVKLDSIYDDIIDSNDNDNDDDDDSVV